MLKSWRIASARPPAGGAAQSSHRGLQLERRAQELGRALLDGFKQNDLLTYASAISFQILTAVIPFLLFVLALWQVSGAVRAVMGALARIYGAPTERPFVKRYSVSFALSIEVGACFILAALCLLLAPFFTVSHPGAVWDIFAFLVRWTLAIALLLLAVGLLVRHAPATEQTLPWVSLGATIVIGSWAIVSLVFYLYLTKVASYESAFGSLAAVIVALAYLYISTTAFLFGVQLDAIIRAQATGALSGVDLGSR